MQFVSFIAVAIAFCLIGNLSAAALADPVEKPPTNVRPVAKKSPKPSAEKAKPEKNQYWLFIPVPFDQMRSFSTDRVTKSNVPYTVDAGHFQY